MAPVRAWLILVHRYLGIALSLLFLVWFVSGVAMIYARDMPRLTPSSRLSHLPALDLERIRLTPQQAAERADRSDSPGGFTLLTVQDRPAYRFTGPTPKTVFADTGEMMPPVGRSRERRHRRAIHGSPFGAGSLHPAAGSRRSVDHHRAAAPSAPQARRRRCRAYRTVCLGITWRGGSRDDVAQAEASRGSPRFLIGCTSRLCASTTSSGVR